MKVKFIVLSVILFIAKYTFTQNRWMICNSPVFNGRVDDIFMVNVQIGYAVCGDGQIIKTTNGGNDWIQLVKDDDVYYRSVEFIDSNIGFVGGFHFGNNFSNTLKKTTDGGATWTDLTALLDSVAWTGICGLAAADSNTIYGCGNWHQEAAYIVKSTDRGDTWTFIDMSSYAASLIDMHFISKDTGFATGRSLRPTDVAIILYTTDGGQTWTNKFTNTNARPFEYCWKIQRVTDQMYVASVEQFNNDSARVLKSIDGGMTWNIIPVAPIQYNIEGIGFIDSLRGWTGGGDSISFQTVDGGNTWDSIPICPYMNRVFKVNDTLLFASGSRIWKYTSDIVTGIKNNANQEKLEYASIKCYPNPVKGNLKVELSLHVQTHALVALFDNKGNKIAAIDNTDKPKGKYIYNISTDNLSPGTYFILLKTHEDKQVLKVIIL